VKTINPKRKAGEEPGERVIRAVLDTPNKNPEATGKEETIGTASENSESAMLTASQMQEDIRRVLVKKEEPDF